MFGSVEALQGMHEAFGAMMKYVFKVMIFLPTVAVMLIEGQMHKFLRESQVSCPKQTHFLSSIGSIPYEPTKRSQLMQDWLLPTTGPRMLFESHTQV
jgi:hypothetical protein